MQLCSAATLYKYKVQFFKNGAPIRTSTRETQQPISWTFYTGYKTTDVDMFLKHV